MIERLATETRSLEELETIVEHGIDAWVEAALAWEEIRNGRRYLNAGFTDFDSYSRQRWGKRRETIDRMIRSAQVVRELNPIGLTALPTNESQARELTRIPDAEQRGEFWERISEGASDLGVRLSAKAMRVGADVLSTPTDEPTDDRMTKAVEYTLYDAQHMADPPLLSIVDVDTGEIVEAEPEDIVEIEPWPIGIPDIQAIPKAAKTFAELLRMSTVTQDTPEDVVEAALRYHASGARNYLARAETILAWHARFVDALRRELDNPIRAIK